MVDSTSNYPSDLINVKISSLNNKSGLMVKGSESFIYCGSYLGKLTLIKERRPKKYRQNQLDGELRIQRLRIESRMIKSALNNNIKVPYLINIDLKSFSLSLEYIEGQNLGLLLSDPNFTSEYSNKLTFFKEFGLIVSKLHDIEIIHGDLTPLNILVNTQKEIYILDFGLSYYSNEIKDKSMDLFILFGSLKIFSHDNEDLFDMFLQGYKTVIGYKSIMENFYKLTNKGRYK